jgi:hypothetical protein
MQMDIKALEQLMITHSFVIRAIPVKIIETYEAYHIKKYPEGVIYYDERFKRDMLRLEKIPKNAGKFIIERVAKTNSLIRFTPKDKYYNSIEEAINDLLSGKENT